MVRMKQLGGLETDTMPLDELAARLGISLTTAYERAQRDALPIPKVPSLGRYRYSRRLFERLMETGSLGPDAELAAGRR